MSGVLRGTDQHLSVLYPRAENIGSYQGLPPGQAGTLAEAEGFPLVVHICGYIWVIHYLGLERQLPAREGRSLP